DVEQRAQCRDYLRDFLLGCGIVQVDRLKNLCLVVTPGCLVVRRNENGLIVDNLDKILSLGRQQVERLQNAHIFQLQRYADWTKTRVDDNVQTSQFSERLISYARIIIQLDRDRRGGLDLKLRTREKPYGIRQTRWDALRVHDAENA